MPAIIPSVRLAPQKILIWGIGLILNNKLLETKLQGFLFCQIQWS
jgi:hypothetical protein